MKPAEQKQFLELVSEYVARGIAASKENESKFFGEIKERNRMADDKINDLSESMAVVHERLDNIIKGMEEIKRQGDRLTMLERKADKVTGAATVIGIAAGALSAGIVSGVKWLIMKS